MIQYVEICIGSDIVRLINKMNSDSLNEKLNSLGLYKNQLKNLVQLQKNALLSKECPQGKVINPKTGRCIKDKSLLSKECPEIH